MTTTMDTLIDNCILQDTRAMRNVLNTFVKENPDDVKAWPFDSITMHLALFKHLLSHFQVRNPSVKTKLTTFIELQLKADYFIEGSLKKQEFEMTFTRRLIHSYIKNINDIKQEYLEKNEKAVQDGEIDEQAYLTRSNRLQVFYNIRNIDFVRTPILFEKDKIHIGHMTAEQIDNLYLRHSRRNPLFPHIR